MNNVFEDATTEPTRRQRRRDRRSRRRHERSLLRAAGWGAATLLGVGILIYLIQMSMPGTPLRDWVELVQGNPGGTVESSPVGLRYFARLEREELYIVTPLCLFCGGLVLGRLAPRREPRRRVLWAGAGLGGGVLLVALALTWVANVVAFHINATQVGGHVTRQIVTGQYLLEQAAWVVGWVVVCVFGTYGGLLWRDLTAGPAPPSTSPTLRPAKP